MRERIAPPDPWFRSLMSVVTLEAGLIVDAALLQGGLGLVAYALDTWGAERFGALSYPETMRLVISSSTAASSRANSIVVKSSPSDPMICRPGG